MKAAKNDPERVVERLKGRPEPATVNTEASALDLFTEGSVTVVQARVEYGLNRSRLYELMTSGNLPYSMATGRRLIPRLAIKRLLAAGLVGASATATTEK